MSTESIMVMREDFNSPEQRYPINEELQELAANESGIGFIYSALNLLAERYELSDVTIVLVNNFTGTQMFRLRGRSIDATLAGELDSNPGVYCLPDMVPPTELDLFFSTCQRSYASQFVRKNVAQLSLSSGNDPSDPTGPSLTQEPLPDEGPSRKRSSTNRHLRASRRTRSLSRGRAARALISRILILVDITVFVMTSVGVHGPGRLILGLILGVVIPGWCVVAPLRFDNAPLELGLTLAVSMSLLMFVAQVLETYNLWHLVALEEITCVVCFPFLLHLSMKPKAVPETRSDECDQAATIRY